MDRVEFRANQEHRGVAVAVVGLLLISLVIGYILLRRLLPVIIGGTMNDYLLVAGFLSIFFSIGILWLTDPWVKRMIPSGYLVSYSQDNDHLAYQTPAGDELQFDLKKEVEKTDFHFKMRRFPKSGRERQIPNSWWCCGSRIMMDDKEITLFAFLAPRHFRNASFTDYSTEINFEELEDRDNRSRASRSLLKTPISGTVIPGRLLVGDRGKFWLAEKQRQIDGVELTAQDFLVFQKMVGDRTQSE